MYSFLAGGGEKGKMQSFFRIGVFSRAAEITKTQRKRKEKDESKNS